MKVTIEGRQSGTQLPPQPPRRIVGPIALGLAALAAVAVVSTSAFESVNDQPALPEEEFLSERLGGLDGSLEMIVEREADTYHLAWASNRPRPKETRLEVTGARLNADGTLIAGIGGNVPDLWIGTADTITPVSTDTLSFVWHQTEPNRIASIRRLGNSYQLWLGELTEGGFLLSTFATVTEGFSVAAYGTWGVAIETYIAQRDTNFFMVFDNQGEPVDRGDASILGSWPGVNGGVAVDEGDEQISFSFGADTADLEIPDQTSPQALYWDPTGKAVAVLLVDGDSANTEVVVGGEVVARAPGRPIGWEQGGQFVLVADPGMLGFLDVSDGSLQTIEIDGTVVDAALVSD